VSQITEYNNRCSEESPILIENIDFPRVFMSFFGIFEIRSRFLPDLESNDPAFPLIPGILALAHETGVIIYLTEVEIFEMIYS